MLNKFCEDCKYLDLKEDICLKFAETVARNIENRRFRCYNCLEKEKHESKDKT